MNQRLKRWESPRKEGRNDKGKGGSARQRQKKKQFQMLRKKLKGDPVNGISFFINKFYSLLPKRLGVTALCSDLNPREVCKSAAWRHFHILLCTP